MSDKLEIQASPAAIIEIAMLATILLGTGHVLCLTAYAVPCGQSMKGSNALQESLALLTVC